MATSPSSPNLLSPPNVYGNPFTGLTPLNEFDFQTFIGYLLRMMSDTEQYKEYKQLQLTYAVWGIKNPLIDMLPIFAQFKGIKLDSNPERTLLRAILTLVANTTARKSIEATVEYVRDVDGSTVKISGPELWGTLFIIYLSTGLPLKYFPAESDSPSFIEAPVSGVIIEGWYIIQGLGIDQDIVKAINLNTFGFNEFSVTPERIAELSNDPFKIARKNPLSTVDQLFNEKGTALRHLKVYTDNAKTIDLTNYQWSMKNILKSLKGGFLDSTVTLSDNSKTYNVDRTILGMFSGYFNTAFKTQVGMGATINTAYRNEFESYLKYLSGQSNGMLDTSNFLNNFAFAQLIGDDYLTLTLIRQLGSDIASLDVTLDEIRKIDKMVGDYVSVIRL